MNSGQTAERVYDALKRRILSREFLPGDKLDPTALSQTLGSSVTPVRDALNMLAGQRLVETRSGEGFFLPHVTEPDLRDLYEWNAEVLALALRQRSHGRPPEVFPNLREPDAIAEWTAALFGQISRISGNAEHAAAIASLDDRLHAARLVESHALDGIVAELDAISAALARGDLDELRKLLAAYYRRRWRAAAAIVRSIYRDS